MNNVSDKCIRQGKLTPVEEQLSRGTLLLTGLMRYGKGYTYISCMQESDGGDAGAIHVWISLDVVEVLEHHGITGQRSFRDSTQLSLVEVLHLLH